MKTACGEGVPEAEPRAPEMRLKVDVMGGATGVISKEILAQAHELGHAVAKTGCILKRRR